MGETVRVRARVVFRGSVQGVGFRYTVVHVASGHAVTGYVENEPEGSVTLVAEGEQGEVEAFVNAVTERMRRHIRGREVEWAPATGEFGDFRIRFAW